MTLSLPTGDGGFETWVPSGSEPVAPEDGGFTSRTAYAAAHVVADPLSDPSATGIAIDWEATLAFRRHLWCLGLGVAEAMDTAQRGSGVDWTAAKELIRQTAAEASGPAVYGAMTDQLDPGGHFDLDQITAAYVEQVSHIEDCGGDAILMSSRHLARAAKTADDYVRVYHQVIEAASGTLMIHWLGPMFDPGLAGYWGAADPWKAAETVRSIVAAHVGKVSGVKLSMLDMELEVWFRQQLPEEVGMFTGDDLNFVDLILGDDTSHSDALLGVFDPIAPVAATAIQALDRGDVDEYRRLLEPTLPLARLLFSPPTHQYKTGVVFLAYICGFQDHFRMLAGAESGRSIPHLSRLLVLADRAGLIGDPDLAAHRMRLILQLGGVRT
ncbi:MAG TPA: dihydrodipicolinate synthase family protein [Acidimicrobiia bacterium]|nr:dihydrodipicolinate synthase family protein [Acidimicrobiia bacterium]